MPLDYTVLAFVCLGERSAEHKIALLQFRGKPSDTFRLIWTRVSLFRRQQRNSLLSFKPFCRLKNIWRVSSVAKEKTCFTSQLSFPFARFGWVSFSGRKQGNLFLHFNFIVRLRKPHKFLFSLLDSPIVFPLVVSEFWPQLAIIFPLLFGKRTHPFGFYVYPLEILACVARKSSFSCGLKRGG